MQRVALLYIRWPAVLPPSSFVFLVRMQQLRAASLSLRVPFLMQRVALLGIRWPAVQRGAILLPLLLLPLLLAAFLLPSALFSPAHSLPADTAAGIKGSKEEDTGGHQGTGTASLKSQRAASELTPELRDLNLKQKVGREPLGPAARGSTKRYRPTVVLQDRDKTM